MPETIVAPITPATVPVAPPVRYPDPQTLSPERECETQKTGIGRWIRDA